jgi:hypothetical protein
MQWSEEGKQNERAQLEARIQIGSHCELAVLLSAARFTLSKRVCSVIRRAIAHEQEYVYIDGTLHHRVLNTDNRKFSNQVQKPNVEWLRG